ncbi:hypothetical protein Tco_0955771 [Tanacetum coccineum]|uniref:Uncharacterized protein n=1 Tax=Tanacetum coccineum TaxID=301880 RepID=A0ABQ5E844_9ASTR
MASLLVKRVASNLKRVRKIASSSRFFSTKGYEFVQHDSMDECILKCDDSLGSSVAHRVVNDAFSPYVSPTENLSRLLNFSDLRIGIEDVRESVKEFMTGNHEENFKGAITISEEECISEDVIEYLKQIDPGRNAFPIIDIMRGLNNAPTGVLLLSCDEGDPQTRNPYGGYAVEIFLDNSLYNVCDMKFDTTGDNRKLFIPKKIVEGNKTIGGNLMFYCEKKFFKPTPWRPT